MDEKTKVIQWDVLFELENTYILLLLSIFHDVWYLS